MMGRTSVLVAMVLAGSTGLTAPAWPQDVTAPCRLCAPGDAVVASKPAVPVRLDVETSLDFDKLIQLGSGDGSFELAPDGSQSVGGSVAAIGARAMVGEVVIRGEPGRLVRIDLPSRVELFGLAGGTIRLESIKSNLPPMPRLDGNGRLSFRFGGVLRVSGDVDGLFRGEIPIDVDYL
ncbi:DUF4402 domain-containing protein [Sphingomonas sp. G124]|uniref:DUF4402 domain-containing protein n=1 Tax=Sphingomonas cremea TaxID=2904799 RepID=A0A9X1QKA8_9SPHN|nr:DUF4402 domain-containing protein [Sphingomonas cremea]MCF2514950.1 DUF4402 domain-containing protein [Sphingomonas cremea]